MCFKGTVADNFYCKKQELQERLFMEVIGSESWLRMLLRALLFGCPSRWCQRLYEAAMLHFGGTVIGHSYNPSLVCPRRSCAPIVKSFTRKKDGKNSIEVLLSWQKRDTKMSLLATCCGAKGVFELKVVIFGWKINVTGLGDWNGITIAHDYLFRAMVGLQIIECGSIWGHMMRSTYVNYPQSLVWLNFCSKIGPCLHVVVRGRSTHTSRVTRLVANLTKYSWTLLLCVIFVSNFGNVYQNCCYRIVS